MNGILRPTALQSLGRQREAMPLRWSLADPVASAATNMSLQKELFALSRLPRRRVKVEPMQRRKGTETQGFRLLGTITRWVSHVNPCFPPHLPVLCAFASWRLCVNCRF